MKLMYELPDTDRAAYDAAHAKCPEEKMMYCLPFNIDGERYVDGFMVFTDRNIYRVLKGTVTDVFDITNASGFKNEVCYGNCGFFAVINGHSRLLCRYTGRNLSRYAVIVRAMEILTERHDHNPIENKTPERFCPKCGKPFLNASTICPSCIDRKEVYRKMWGMTRGLRLLMSVPLIVAVFNVIFSFIVPAIQAVAINKYINPIGIASGPKRGLYAVVAAMLCIEVFRQVLGLFQARASAVAGNRFNMMLRTLLYEKIQSLSISAIQRRTPGDLMGRINSDTTNMQNFVVSTMPALFIQLASFIVAFIVLLIMNPLVCLFVFVPVPFVVFAVYKFWKLVRRLEIKRWLAQTRAQYLLHDILNGIRVVKSFGQEDREIVHFGQSNYTATKHVEYNNKLVNTLFPILSFAVQFGLYIIYLYGYLRVFDNAMQLGTLYQYISYANLVYAPLVYITTIPSTIASFMTSSSKVFEILEEQNEVTDIDLPLDISIEGEISLRNVTFGYHSYDPVLENVTLDIKPGEMIGIVGHSGSGKTTLINLIMRLYDVNEGEIVIDGVNIKDISQNALRKQIGVVLQETILFDGTIRDNIRYARPFASDEEVIEAARIANAHDFIINLPDGYNTMVGEKGMSLSGGERQRVSIARAVINNPRILILDEATAALDTETEKQIQDALNKVVQNRTTLAIAHRLSTLRNADRLLVLDHGRLAEFGTHAELLENKGIYYKLVMAQKKMAESVKK